MIKRHGETPEDRRHCTARNSRRSTSVNLKSKGGNSSSLNQLQKNHRDPEARIKWGHGTATCADVVGFIW